MFAIASCGRIGFDPTSPAGGGDSGSGQPDDAARICGAWQAPAPIIFANTIFDDWEPTVAPNGGPIVFSSNRTGLNELFMMPQSPTSPSDIVRLASLDNGMKQWGPAWNADGTKLYFERANGTGITLYTAAFDGQTFGPAIPEPGFAVSDVILGAAISQDETELFYNDNEMAMLGQIQRATRGAIGDPWTKQGPVNELDANVGNGYPTLTFDGHTIIWASEGTTDPGRWLTATRPARAAAFSTPVLFDDIPHTTGIDLDPDMSSRDTVFAFSSTRAGGNVGGADLWITTRTCN
jgi:hypothetical protein